MKKIDYIAFAVILMTALFSCSEDKLYSPVRPVEIIATINNGPDSRVTHTDNVSSLISRWEEGDTIGLISADGRLANVPLVAVGSGMETTFRPVDGADFAIPRNTDIYAYYPYNKSNPGNLTVAIAPGVIKKGYYGNYYTTVEAYEEEVMRFEDNDKVENLYDFLYCKADVNGSTIRLKFEHALSYLRIKFHASDLIEEGRLIPQIFARMWNTKDERYSNGEDNCVDSIMLVNGQIIVGHGNGFSLHTKEIGLDAMQAAANQGKGIYAYVPVIPKSLTTDRGCFEFYACNRGKDANGNDRHNKLLGVFLIPEGGLKPGYLYSAETEKNYSENIMKLQREALEALYYATDGDNWAHNDGWLTDAPLCEWYGVVITDNSTGHYMYGSHDVEYISALKLENNNLNGYLPSLLGKLPMLSYIDVSNYIYNDYNIRNIIKLEGSFHWLQDIDHPLYIRAEKCGISGRLIDEIPVINNRMELNLSSNNLNGPLPEVESVMLEPIYEGNGIIDLSFNYLTGTIPESWAKFYPEDIKPWNPIIDYKYNNQNYTPYIERFNLCHNCLEGEIPQEIVDKIPYRLYLYQQDCADKPSFNRIPIGIQRQVIDKYDNLVDLYSEYIKNRYTLIIPLARDCPLGRPLSDDDLFKISRLAHIYSSRGLGVFIFPTWSDFSESMINLPESAKIVELADKSLPGELFTIPNDGFGTFWCAQYLLVDSDGYLVAAHGEDCNRHEDLIFPLMQIWNVNNFYDYIAQLFGDEKFDPGIPDMYTSTDYSADGEVVTLQKASVGRGVDIVLMGNGYVDTEIADGTYERIIREEMEGLFSYEPYKSLRDRFNVYMVKAVSPNNVWIDGSVHAMDGDGGLSMDKILDYAGKAPINGVPQVGLIFNIGDKEFLGRSYTTMAFDDSFVAILLDNDPDVFVHEVGGHGIGKLADEYTEHSVNETDMPAEIEALESHWRDRGWYLNIDYRNDPDLVNWKHFLADSRYAAEELSIFAGAFAKDVHFFRPSINSMMNSNRSPFNAPSRELIYKRIMQASEGPDWKYDFETFYNFDRENIVKDPIGWGMPLKHVERLSDKTLPPKIVRTLRGARLENVTK